MKFTILSIIQPMINSNKNVLKLQVRDEEGTTMDAMYFGDVQKFLEYYVTKAGKAAFTYYPTINEYQGRKTMQIVIQNYQ